MASHSIKKLKLWRAGKRHRAQVSARFWLNDIKLAQAYRQPVEALLERLPAVEGQWPAAIDGPLVFAVCDPCYFSLHAESLMASLQHYAPGSALHLHLYDPGQAQFDALVRLRQRYPAVRLSETWERTRLAGLDVEKRVIYFQSARFIRLYSALRATGRPLVTVDIDSLIRGPVEELVAAAHSGKNVLASMVYASPSPASLRFFEGVARRLAAHLLAGVQTEMLDQRCLWKLYMMQRKMLRFWRIPQRFSDWDLGDDSIIWHGKGPRKESQKYLQLKRQLLAQPARRAGEDGLMEAPAPCLAALAERPFRIGWKPQNDEPRVASTRIRCLNPLKALQAQGFPVELYSEKRRDEYDIVVFLKAYNENDIRLAEDLKARGKLVVFDLCDNHFLMNEARVARLRRMFQLADHWVTSTPALAGVIREHLGGMEHKPIHVIEDAVEEALITPALNVTGKVKAHWQMAALSRFLDRQGHQGATHLVWFGNHQGSHRDSGLVHVQKLRPLLETLAVHHSLTLTIISNSRDSFEKHFAGWQMPLFYMDWSPHNFFEAMKRHDIAVIPIEINEFTKVKTNNRIALSLYLGLGVVADSIGSYEEFAGCTFLDDWEKGLETYITRPELMAAHVAQGRHIINEHYSLPVIAKRWGDLFDAIWKGGVQRSMETVATSRVASR